MKHVYLTALYEKLRGTLSTSAPAQICLTKCIRDFADFWPRSGRIGRARCYPFQSADVLELLCDTVLSARAAEPLFVAILGHNGDPLLLMPFSLEHNYNEYGIIKVMRILSFLDGGFCDYNAPVVFPSVANWNRKTACAVWRELRQVLPRFDIARFEKMPERVGHLPNPFRFLNTRLQGTSGHALQLFGTWEEFSSKLPRRQQLRRKTRQLSDLGNLTFEIADTSDKYDEFIEALIRQKRRRYLETIGHDEVDRRPGYIAYLREARRLLRPAGPVCLFALKSDDTILATEFGIAVGNRYIGQIFGFEGGVLRIFFKPTIV